MYFLLFSFHNRLWICVWTFLSLVLKAHNWVHTVELLLLPLPLLLLLLNICLVHSFVSNIYFGMGSVPKHIQILLANQDMKVKRKSLLGIYFAKCNKIMCVCVRCILAKKALKKLQEFRSQSIFYCSWNLCFGVWKVCILDGIDRIRAFELILFLIFSKVQCVSSPTIYSICFLCYLKKMFWNIGNFSIAFGLHKWNS